MCYFVNSYYATTLTYLPTYLPLPYWMDGWLTGLLGRFGGTVSFTWEQYFVSLLPNRSMVKTFRKVVCSFPSYWSLSYHCTFCQWTFYLWKSRWILILQFSTLAYPVTVWSSFGLEIWDGDWSSLPFTVLTVACWRDSPFFWLFHHSMPPHYSAVLTIFI